MYHHILIPTDGSKLAHRAVTMDCLSRKQSELRLLRLSLNRHSMFMVCRLQRYTK